MYVLCSVLGDTILYGIAWLIGHKIAQLMLCETCNPFPTKNKAFSTIAVVNIGWVSKKLVNQKVAQKGQNGLEIGNWIKIRIWQTQTIMAIYLRGSK